jgi:hypothetical protein
MIRSRQQCRNGFSGFRDLLPKLMSGEIRVKDAEKVMEAAL